MSRSPAPTTLLTSIAMVVLVGVAVLSLLVTVRERTQGADLPWDLRAPGAMEAPGSVGGVGGHPSDEDR